MNREHTTTSKVIDATYAERLRLFEASPELYFRQYPKPRFGFQPASKRSAKHRKNS